MPTPASSIDQILDTHQLAQQRRAAGKPVWDRTIRIKDLLSDDASEESAARIAREIAARLKRQLPAAWVETGEEVDVALMEVIDGMASLTADSYADDDSYSAVEDLNNMLAELYDWADRCRVWVS